MKHCRTCRHCVTVSMMGIPTKWCKFKDVKLNYSFFAGFRCTKWRKARGGRNR